MAKVINKKNMLPTGAILHGNYRIDDYLSSGGFGNTYVATHTVFGVKRAIKEFFIKDVSERENDSSNVKVSNEGKEREFAQQLKKFFDEAKRLFKLNNKHIVKVYDLFEANGTAYYVMDYIDGEDLKEHLERTGKPMTEAEVKEVLSQILDALSEVHSKKIWHMDIKPANIMMESKNGKNLFKLIDFGASKQIDPSAGESLSTTAMAYTMGYAPTEQMDKKASKIGPWTDFYALGATLYNLLTGKTPPLTSDLTDDHTPDKHLALPMPGISDEMRQLVVWFMKNDRTERPQSVAQIMERFNFNSDNIAEEGEDDDDITINDDPGPNPPPIPTPDPHPKPKPKPNYKKWLWGAAGLLLALVLYGLFTSEPDPVAPDPVIQDSIQAVGQDTDSSVSVQEEPAAPVIEKVVDKKMTIPLGECTYTGEVNAEGLPHGNGKASLLNGDVCQGSFVNGQLDGKIVTFRFKEGDTFMGEVRNGKFVQGRYTNHSSGSYFVGTFKDDAPASGTWYDKNGKVTKKM